MVKQLIAPFIPSRTASLFSLVIAAFAIMHVLNNGIDYVSWPKLKVLDATLNYNGKGFEYVYVSSISCVHLV